MTSSPAIFALMFNALVWGVSWWPFRQLHAHSLHPLWSTVIIYVIATAVIGAWRPGAFRQVLTTPVLWVLVLASGATNAAFNWAVSIGEVVRVVLLFYLMPLWAVLLAYLLLGERLTPFALARIVLSLGGAVIVLKPEGAAWPLPATLADWLGIIGGFGFALNNVMLRREAHRPDEVRAMAMFAGGVLVAGLLGGALATQGGLPWPPAPQWTWLSMAVGLGLLFLLSNLALQYGAARLPANVTAVVMLTEVVFAAVSAVWLGGEALDARAALGGALILAASMLSALERPAHA